MQEEKPGDGGEPAGRGARAVSERIEGPHPPGDRQIDHHDDDRHHGEGGGERDVPGGALLRVDRLADEVARTSR